MILLHFSLDRLLSHLKSMCVHVGHAFWPFAYGETNGAIYLRGSYPEGKHVRKRGLAQSKAPRFAEAQRGIRGAGTG